MLASPRAAVARRETDRREPSSYILTGVSTSTEGRRSRFVAYEDALASFYALQDGTQKTLAESGEITRSMEPDYFAFTFATVDP